MGFASDTARVIYTRGWRRKVADSLEDQLAGVLYDTASSRNGRGLRVEGVRFTLGSSVGNIVYLKVNGHEYSVTVNVKVDVLPDED